MRYAIVSDIHANLVAWEAVLADLGELGIDEIVCLGDVVGYGPKPAEVLDGVRAVTGNFVMGNHDAAAVGMMDYSIFNDHAREAIEWTMTELDDPAKEFLSSVPLSIESGDVLFVHAEIDEPGHFGYIDGVEKALENFKSGKHFVTFIGHTHLPKIFEMDGDGEVSELLDEDTTLDPNSRYIINVGSVGEPRNPEDLRARYVVYDTETEEVFFRRVVFDIVAYREHLEATSLSMRPFFLRTYEFSVEGRDVEVSQGGSLVDMQVTQGSASLITSAHVATVGQLSGSGPVLASAKPSNAPKIMLLVAAVLAVCFGGYLAMNKVDDPQPAGKLTKETNPSKKRQVEEEEDEGKLAEESAAGSQALDNSNQSLVPAKVAVDSEKAVATEAEVKTAMAAKEEARPKPEPPKPKPPKKADPIKRAWWRMDGGGENGPLVDGSKKFKLEMVASGAKIPAIAPDLIPLNQTKNDSALKLGIWQESKPSGEFVLGPDHSFTFEGWFLVGKINRPVFLVGTRSVDEGGAGWHLDLRPPGRGKSQGQMSFFFDSGENRTEALADEVSVADLAPHHFAAVWDHDHSKNEGEMRLYLDGVQVAANVLARAGLSKDQADSFRVGWKGNPDRLALDELRFSRDALSPHEFLLRPSIIGARIVQSDPKSRDSFAVSGNWEDGKLPEGSDNVIIGEGLTVQSDKLDTPEYTGALVLREKSKLILWSTMGLTALPRLESKIVMHRGSEIVLRAGNTKFGPVEMLADATIWGGQSTQGHRGTRQFVGPISGSGKLTINGVNKNTIIFEAPNSITGGMEFFSSQKQAFRVLAKGKGTLGKGDVIVGDYCSLVLAKDSGNVIESDVTLHLKGANGSESKKLVLDSGETIGAFVIDGKDQGKGTFSAKTHKEIGGTGTLKVVGLK